MLSWTPHRVSHRRRSLLEWAGRIALVCGLAVLAYHSVAFSVVQVAAKSQPQAADARVFYDARLSAAHAAALMIPNATAVERARAGELSRIALRRDPTAVSAVATLGLVTLARGDTAHARHLLAYAQMLSRRNVQTQLWSIEDAVGRNDISDALRWYDIALRTKPALNEVLYPVLAQASRDATLRAALVHMLTGKPPWVDSYVGYLALQKDDPESTAALFTSLRARGVALPASAQVSVVNMLLDAGNVDKAWRYYVAIRPGADRKRARDPRFTALLDTSSAFDWTTRSDNGLSSSIQRTRDGGAFEFSAPASVGGPVLQQVQLLPAGIYRLSGHSDGIAQESRSLPYWVLTCRGDGRELGRVTMLNSAQAGGMFAGTLTVPANCPVQTLTLFAQTSDAIGGTSGQIDRVVLEPAR